MSLGGSQWCRPMSMNSHRSTDHDEDRWTDYSRHRSTSSADSTECNASESDVDRHNTPPIDRQAPLTYRVRLPSIDNDYINALRPPPKPLANPPEQTPNPLNSSTEPVQEEQESEGRRLRKRREKIPKNLKREANDKEMDGFTKRVLRIPIEKPFDEAYFTNRLWMFFRETKVTEEDIRRMFHQVRGKMKHRITLTKKSDPGKFAIPCIVKGVEFPHSMCDTGASKELGFIGACHCGAEYESEYETEYLESIDTTNFPSIDSNVSMVTDDHNNTSLDVMHPLDHFASPNHCYQHFAFQPPTKRGHDDYSIGSWAENSFHESFAVDTNERLETYNFTNTFPTSFDTVQSTSVDPHPRPAKQPLTSIDTSKRTSIDIRAAAKTQEQENIPSLTRFTDTYINRFAPPKPPTHIRANTHANKMNTLPSTSTEKSMKSNHLKNTNSAKITQPLIDVTVSTLIDTTLNPNLSISKMNNYANIDYGFLTPDEFGIFRDPDGNARAMDGRILQVSREDIADILQVTNGPDNLFSQQRGTPDVILTDPNNHAGVTTTETNPDLSRQQKGQASIDGIMETSIDRVTPTSIDMDNPTSIDRCYECGSRAFDMYGARKFTWEQRDEYGVYRDERGHARSTAGEMIPVTKDNIRKILERASLFEESHICLPEHATSFTLTRLAPELYTKEEIDEIVFGICGAQEKLGEELKTLIDETHQPLDRGYNELFGCMAEMRTEIDSLCQQFEKEATTSASIDAPCAKSIDVSLPTAQTLAEPRCSTQHMDEWEVSYIDTKINDVYCLLNNNVDWLSTKIELLQQDLDTIRKKDQHPATSIDMCTFTSLDAKVSAMNERMRTYEDMHDRFISPVMIDLNKLSSQLLDAQKDMENITNQSFLQEKSTSIDRLRGPWIDGRKPVELLPYTAAEVDKITSKIYTALDNMEERLDKRCDDIYFPFDNKIKVKAIQRQLAAQHQISASIDRTKAKSIDDNSLISTNEHIIASIDAESTTISEQLIHKTVESMQKELTDLSAYAYDNIGWHQVSIDNIHERLQNISNVLGKMDDKWTRNDEATRNSTKDAKADQPINYTLALNRQKEVNRTWWQPPLSFDSWKPVQSWSLILQWKQTLTQERNLEREKLGTNFYLQLQIPHKGHFTRADHLEVDERKNNRSIRISADDRYQEMPRQMKINIDRCTHVPSIDAWLEPIDRCPQLTIDRCWQKCIGRRLNRLSIDTLLCLHLTGETQDLNSGKIAPASETPPSAAYLVSGPDLPSTRTAANVETLSRDVSATKTQSAAVTEGAARDSVAIGNERSSVEEEENYERCQENILVAVETLLGSDTDEDDKSVESGGKLLRKKSQKIHGVYTPDARLKGLFISEKKTEYRPLPKTSRAIFKKFSDILSENLVQQFEIKTSHIVTNSVFLDIATPGKWLSDGVRFYSWNRVEGIYHNKRGGDCAPCAVKFIEMHSNGDGKEEMCLIRDIVVDKIREQYAMDCYKEFVGDYRVANEAI
ncbi:hypothetical protein IGI04_035752 [Brassica rapa subsp. trilocularis]|uniref:Ubiquitin-like protease family profile domain-containing protein n=1 Tax=Brassica rapa subsp. trilocularis TaxID=1813537 RepID=A0ABQ7LDG3_BRACM|nr:hypothetical protein IGI04_035752 [Brassica rapa subsp. trilocularis]